jgi:hypothetical protein
MLPDPELARILAERRRIEAERRSRDAGFVRDARQERRRDGQPRPDMRPPIVDPGPCPPCPRPAERAARWATT